MNPSLRVSRANRAREPERQATPSEQDTNDINKRKMDDHSPASKSPEPKRIKANGHEAEEVSQHENGNSDTQTIQDDRQNVIVQQPTPQKTPVSPVEKLEHQVEDKREQSQLVNSKAQTQSQNENEKQSLQFNSTTPLRSIELPLVRTPHGIGLQMPDPASVRALMDHTQKGQSQVPRGQHTQQQSHELQTQGQQIDGTATNLQQGVLPPTQGPHGIEVQFPRQEQSRGALSDEEIFEALYQYLEAEGPKLGTQAGFESRITRARLDDAQALTGIPNQPASQPSQAQGQLQQSYGMHVQHPQLQNIQVNSGPVGYNASIQIQRPWAYYENPQGRKHPRSVVRGTGREQQQQLQPTYIDQAQPRASEPGLEFLQTTKEKVEYQEAFAREGSRLQAIQQDKESLGRLIVSKRDLFHNRGILFESLAQLYWDLLDTAEEAGGRTSVDDWAEDLSIQLLEVLQRMEEDEIEIRQLEVRFGEMGRELNRIF